MTPSSAAQRNVSLSLHLGQGASQYLLAPPGEMPELSKFSLAGKAPRRVNSFPAAWLNLKKYHKNSLTCVNDKFDEDISSKIVDSSGVYSV